MKRFLIIMLILLFSSSILPAQAVNINNEDYTDSDPDSMMKYHNNEDFKPHEVDPSGEDTQDTGEDDADDGTDGNEDAPPSDSSGESGGTSDTDNVASDVKSGVTEGNTNAALSEEKIAKMAALDTERAELQAALDAEKKRNAVLMETASETEREEAARREAALQAQIDEKKQQMSEVIGDPVYVTTGQYYDSCTDVSIRYLISKYDMVRTYTPDCEYEGCLGKNWISSLDSRLIFGIEPVTDSDIKNLLDNEITPLQKAIDESIASYCKATGKTGSKWESILPESCSRLEEAQELYQDLLKQEKKAAYLNNRVPANSSYREADKLVLRIEKLLTEVISRISEYADYKNLCEKYDRLIRQYSEELNILLKLYDEYKSNRIQNGDIRGINSQALLPGTKEYHQTTGYQTITFLDESGIPFSFTSSSSSAKKGAPYAAPGTKWIIRDNKTYDSISKTDGGYTLLLKNGSCRYFSEEGLLVSYTDAHGNWIRFSRNSNGKVTEINTSCGTAYTLLYDGKYISSVYRNGMETPLVQYTYTNDRLSSVTDEKGDSLQYTWDNGLISSIIKPDGSTITFSYDAINKSGAYLTTGSKNEENYSESYDYDSVRKTTRHIDHAGVTTVYTYDDSGNIVRIVHADGLVVTRGYDSSGNMISESRNGSTSYFYYDSSGRMIKACYADGTTESWSYDTRGFLVSYKGTDGIQYNYTRNETGNILFCNANGSLLYSCTYSPSGLCTSQTLYSEQPVTSLFSYDARGNITKAVTGTKVEEWTWDDTDNVTSYKSEGKTLLSFSSDGRTSTITAYNGLVMKTTTNERKDIVCVEELDSVTGNRRVSEYEYDKRHLVTSFYQGDGTYRTLIGRFCYDGEGKTTAIISYRKDAAVIKYYDYVSDNGILLSEPSSVICFSVTPETIAENELRTEAGFKNADLKALSQTAGDCRVLFSKTDGTLSDTASSGSGNKEQTNSSLSFSYSNNRRRLTVSEGGLYEVTYTLNAWEEPVSKTDGNGNTTTFEYDCFGNVISSTDPYGYTTVFEYDEAGQLTRITYPDGSWKSFSYDAVRNLTQVMDSAGIVLTQEFDVFGNLIRKGGRNLVETAYSYDNQNRLTCVYEADTLMLSYEYSENGTVTTKDANGNKINYSIPEEQMITPELNVDVSGNITSIQDENAHIIYEYDAGNRLVRQKNLTTGYEVTYKYDKAGNRTEMQDSNRTVLYEYGRNNEITSMVELNDCIVTSSVSFSYDSLGRETVRTYGNGSYQATFYDDAGNVQIITQHDYNGSLIWGEGFLYDESGRISTRICSDMTLSLINYDNRGRPISILETDKAAFSEYKGEAVYLSPDNFYGLQALLNKMQPTLGNALTVLQSMGRTEYEYDTNSNVTAEKTADGIIRFEYDTANRLLRAGETTYSYDDKGNMVYESSPFLTVEHSYSAANRLISSLVTDSQSGSSILKTYEYDPYGRRSSQTEYMLNPNGMWSLSDNERYEYDGFSFAYTGIFE